MSKVIFELVQGGCGIHRMLYPARFMAAEPEFSGRVFCTREPFVEPGDSLVMHGITAPADLVAIGNVLKKGGKFIWSIDDDYTSIPDWNPAKLHDEDMWMPNILSRLADFIVVSTEHLASKIDFKYRDKVRVCKNMMDVMLYNLTDSPSPLDDSGRIRFLWSGSLTHRKDVEILDPVIDYLFEKYTNKFTIDFLGGPPSDRISTRYLGMGVRSHPGVNVVEYDRVVSKLRPHVVFAPLYECEFNRSKSAIRVYDGWCLSAAVIASRFGEYCCIRHDEDGLLCSTVEDWIAAVDSVMQDFSNLARIASNGRRRVEAEFNWRVVGLRKDWRNLLREILN